MSLDDVVGYQHFAQHFAEFREHYVVIGGIATVFSLESAGMAGRPTKDIDMVVLANPNTLFADKLCRYVADGGYQIEADTEHDTKKHGARNYRFRKPNRAEFPFQIEIFSTVPFEMELHEGQAIIPFATSPGLQSLSAILMNTEYFNLVKAYITQDARVPLLTMDALIPMKARAFIDLSERRAQGENVDHKDIKKHRNDVLKLGATLGDLTCHLPSAIAEDLIAFFDHPDIKGLAKDAIRDIVNDARTTLFSVREQVYTYYQLK